MDTLPHVALKLHSTVCAASASDDSATVPCKPVSRRMLIKYADIVRHEVLRHLFASATIVSAAKHHYQHWPDSEMTVRLVAQLVDKLDIMCTVVGDMKRVFKKLRTVSNHVAYVVDAAEELMQQRSDESDCVQKGVQFVLACVFTLLPFQKEVPVYWHVAHSFMEDSCTAVVIEDLLHNGNFDTDYRKAMSSGLSSAQTSDMERDRLLCRNVLSRARNRTVAEAKLTPRHIYIDMLRSAGAYGASLARSDVLSRSLRPYQHELAAGAMGGGNTVMLAPTGCGKTTVAAAVFAAHMHERFVAKAAFARALFIVPTVPLANQQCAEMRRLLNMQQPSGRHVKVCSLHLLQQNDSRLEAILAHHVTVSTAQAIYNLLEYSGSDPLHWDDITMLIVDECHHTNKSHPYHNLLRHYARFCDASKSDASVPQVLGMTASLGTDNTEMPEAAMNHVLLMCARLRATCLSVVQQHVDNLRLYCRDIVDEVTVCRSGDYRRTSIYTQTESFMCLLEEYICETTAALVDQVRAVHDEPHDDLIDKVLARPPPRRHSDRYISWVSSLLRDVLPSVPVPRGCDEHEALAHMNDTCVHLKIALRFLRLCALVLDVMAHLPAFIGLQQLFERVDGIRRGNVGTALYAKLKNAYKDTFELVAGGEHDCGSVMQRTELCDSLVRLLRNHFAHNAESKVIVFARTRHLVTMLAAYLNDVSYGLQLRGVNEGGAVDGVAAVPLISTRSSRCGVNEESVRDGASDTEMLRNLAMFRSGQAKILVATSVAEEGIDIPQCNMIVVYNVISNEIARTQRQGRARMLHSKCVLLTLAGSLADRELANVRKQLLLTNIVHRKIAPMGHNWLQIEVNKRVEEIRRDERKVAEQREHKRRTLANNKYRLECAQCNGPICESGDVRRVAGSHYACITPAIWLRAKAVAAANAAKLRLPSYEEDMDGVCTAGSICCSDAKCGLRWGRLLRLGPTAYVPTLVVDSFLLTQVSPEGVDRPCGRAKSWRAITEMHFHVDEITTDERLLISDLMCEIRRRALKPSADKAAGEDDDSDDDDDDDEDEFAELAGVLKHCDQLIAIGRLQARNDDARKRADRRHEDEAAVSDCRKFEAECDADD